MLGVSWRRDESETRLGFGNFSRVEEGNADFGATALMKPSKRKRRSKPLS